MTTINASKKKWILLLQKQFVYFYRRKGIFSKILLGFWRNENRKHFEQKSSTSPIFYWINFIQIKRSSLCMSVDLLLHLWWALLKNNLLYNNCVYIICRIHLILSKEKKMNEKSWKQLDIFYSFSNTIEVTFRPVWPPNWNVGVGKTTRTLKWLEKKARSSASVQLQEVMKKSPLGFSMEATLLR